MAAPREVEGNGMLAFVEYVLLPTAGLKGTKEFRVEREGMDTLVYTSIDKVNDDYEKDVLTPQLLKRAVTRDLVAIMEPIQAKFQASKEWQETTRKAYPVEELAKKVTKVKDRGTRFPGGNIPIQTKEGKS